MDDASRTKRPMKKIDFGRDDLVRDGFDAGSPVTVPAESLFSAISA